MAIEPFAIQPWVLEIRVLATVTLRPLAASSIMTAINGLFVLVVASL
jgi:hypothetical protein